jgi:hypothetical protein
MADNINLNGPYDTKVPSYNESADIQQALKLFLYGTVTPPSNQSEILSTSLAGNLKRIDADIVTINNRGLGSAVLSTQPTGVADGYVWLDSDSGVSASVQYSESYYSGAAPQSPTTGTLWVDSNSSPLFMYVWSGTAWRAIGA